MANLFRRFPFQVALGALLFYVITLSHGVTVGSLSLTSKIAGWDWLPMSDHPLLWLLTLPLRLLPAAWVSLGLNLFSAVCGAATLGMLVRTLELLPWFRPLATLKGWHGRLPLLLAVAVCGLEFSFWQEATAATGEMLDVLLLAIAAWCLLEYRDGKNNRWLLAAAFVWGAGMAENWVMQITLPLFIGSLVWLRRLRFFKLKFILTMAGMGLAGLAIYALLPLANGLLPSSPWNLHQAWVYSLREGKVLLRGIYYQFWVTHLMMSILILLFYLLPLLALLMPFRNEETKNKSQLERSLIWIFRGVRAGLLLACIWLAFDPTFGPRQQLARQMNLPLPVLTFDYLNALGIGFLTGNLLLILQPRDGTGRRRKFRRQLVARLELVAAPVLTVLLVVVVLGLGTRNLTAITLANRQPLTQFGELELSSLPTGGGIVVSDFPEKLEIFQAAQTKHRDKSGWLPVDTKSLPMPEYRERLERMRPGGWMTSTNAHELVPGEMLQLLNHLVQTSQVFYIHPSFGYFFELFYQQPAGLVYELNRYPAIPIIPPPLTAETIAQNEKIWDDLVPEFESLQKISSPAEPSLVKSVEKFLCLETVVPGQVVLLEEWYSLALDDWGVQLQRNGKFPAAQRRFNQALALNTNNWAVRLNLYCNTKLQAGTDMSLASPDGLASQLTSPQNQARIMSLLGPIDEPASCYILGHVYQQVGLPWLALQQFERTHELAPKALAPEFALAEMYVRCQLKNQATATINRLRGEIKKLPDNAGLDVQFALLEANFWLSQTNLNHAVGVLQDAVEQHPAVADKLLGAISQAYFTTGDFTNAGQVVARLLEREPDNVPALLLQSGVLLKTQRADLAIPVLNHVLSITNSQNTKFIRALAYIETTNYAAAKLDYVDLETSPASGSTAELGLAQIAQLQHDTNQAIHYLELCITNTPPDTAQWRNAREQLDSLKSSSP